MSAGGTQLAWMFFLAGAVPAIVLAVAGVALLARRSFALKKRMDAYRELPIATSLVTADLVLARIPKAVASAADLARRAQRAIAAIRAARTRLADAFTLFGAALRSRAGRTPES